VGGGAGGGAVRPLWRFGYRPLFVPYDLALDGLVPVVEARFPPGRQAFDRGATVESRDGEALGAVEAVVVGGPDQTITHFVLRMGGLARAREVTLPVSTVAQAAGVIVRLTLTADDVKRLPAVPARRRYDAAGGPGTLELLSLVFPESERAAAALRTAQEAVARGRVERFDAAVVRKGEDGRVTSREEGDVTAGRGALLGAVAGGVLGLLAGPRGPGGRARRRRGRGGLVGGAVDRGVPDRYLRDLGHALHPGTSALVVLVERRSAEALLEALEPLGGDVLRLALTDEMVARLTAPGQAGGAPAQGPPGRRGDA
jgi:uncharacterized membrane protein